MCALKAAHKLGPVHGRYCGLGGKNGRPIDALDQVCRMHDECWVRRGQFDCRCDRQLAARTAKIAESGAGSSTMRKKAGRISDLFERIACLPG